MTSKLKCPVCQQDLGIILCDTDDFVCSKCRMCGTEKLWQALIQAKQDLEIARQALKKIESTEWYDSMSSYEIMTFTAMKALEQIEHKD